MSSVVKMGDTVKLHYKAKTADLLIFDSLTQMDPLVFTVGDGQILTAFENALIGMKAGEKKIINLQSDDAFGPYVEELITTVDKSELPSNLEIEKDQQLQIQQPDGQIILVKVIDMTDKDITFDANHPLAGKDIEFDIHLIEIK
ncbi:MAG: FKBP-type 16 kDa peptidyl-prolyl cis-trans isomerase [Candidatus Anoxychlamydiales bacterium]|uniref:peptidylprolyl isomerase n=1 Tax=marine sediment metagenome TaxID=412755 RepID=A0A0F9JHW9_9ZZZZ|nr:FKBP-type 16 kDa peptidyl-prolyl cis-trans isomerase [Candidatus Anoxychlamydiales bacterium]NGX41083.1 FKBP-type 16 kDa peptidyl-prolyl cis-trans isomerase [Candidatus Anoxychlamydiales bacterium]